MLNRKSVVWEDFQADVFESVSKCGISTSVGATKKRCMACSTEFNAMIDNVLKKGGIILVLTEEAT